LQQFERSGKRTDKRLADKATQGVSPLERGSTLANPVVPPTEGATRSQPATLQQASAANLSGKADSGGSTRHHPA